MRLEKLKYKNFRGIREVNLDIDKKNVIIYGDNGTGKTSILNGMTYLFYRILNKTTPNMNRSLSLKDTDISFGEAFTRIEMEIILNGNTFPYYRQFSKKDNKRTHDEKIQNEVADEIKRTIENEELNTPIIVNYGVHRAVYSVPLRIRKKHVVFDKTVTFENCLYPITDFQTFFEWFQDREHNELSEIKESQNPNYVDKQIDTVRTAIYKFLNEVSDLRITYKPHKRMVVTKGKKTLNIEQLSDGEKCLLGLIGDLARRLAIANPSLQNPLDGTGIVLIDEIELHLHPGWQRKIISKLFNTFPNIQFFITTHSPQVLGEVKDANIFKLECKDGEVTCYSVNGTFGKDSNIILECFMDTDKENENIKKSIDKLFSLIEEHKFSEAKEHLKQIANELESSHPDLVEAEVLIRRGMKGQ
jgi:predicted ATP-binding protein involved in virulence